MSRKLETIEEQAVLVSVVDAILLEKLTEHTRMAAVLRLMDKEAERQGVSLEEFMRAYLELQTRQSEVLQ